MVVGAVFACPSTAQAGAGGGVDVPFAWTPAYGGGLGLGIHAEFATQWIGVFHSRRFGADKFSTGEQGSRWTLRSSYRLYPFNIARFMPFVGTSFGVYLGGGDGLAVTGEVGAEFMFSKSLEGLGLRLSAEYVHHSNMAYVTFPMSLIFWWPGAM